jgi:hypothetical protein
MDFGATKDIMFAIRNYYISVVFNQGVKLIPTCFITHLMGHIVVGCFNDLQVGFESIRHKQENTFPQH